MLAALFMSLVSKVKWEASMIDRAEFFALLAHSSGTKPAITEDLFSMPIDIVVPQYRYARPPTEAWPIDRRTKVVEVGRTYLNYKGDILFNNLKDVRAAQRVHAELEKMHFKNIRILQDTEPRDKDRDTKCEILIGLCVNTRVIDAMVNMPKPNLFKIEPENDGHFSISLATITPQGVLAPPSRNNRHLNEQGLEVMFISKFWHHGHVQIIVGGLSPEGTLICADTFCDRLVDLTTEIDPVSRQQVSSNRFAAIMKCDPVNSPSPFIQEMRVG